MNYVISGIAFIIMMFAYIMRHYVVEEKWKGVFREITDAVPVLMLAYYWNIYAAIFLIGCEVCNEFINENKTIGMCLYAPVYSLIGIFLCKAYWNQGVVLGNTAIFVALAVAVVLIFTSLIVNILSKQEFLITVVMPIYIIIALIPLVCAGMLTMNIGLFSLVIGDTLLGLAWAFKKKTVLTISESFFFLGEATVPIILMTL